METTLSDSGNQPIVRALEEGDFKQLESLWRAGLIQRDQVLEIAAYFDLPSLYEGLVIQKSFDGPLCAIVVGRIWERAREVVWVWYHPDHRYLKQQVEALEVPLVV